MKKIKTVFIIATLTAAVILTGLTGCKEKPEGTTTETDIVKTDAEYKKQAEEEINKENMMDELDRLEKAVDQDTE